MRDFLKSGGDEEEKTKRGEGGEGEKISESREEKEIEFSRPKYLSIYKDQGNGEYKQSPSYLHSPSAARDGFIRLSKVLQTALQNKENPLLLQRNKTNVINIHNTYNIYNIHRNTFIIMI